MFFVAASKALPKIASAHLYGNETLGIKKHKKPITLFTFQKLFAKNKESRSRVLKRLRDDQDDWRKKII